MVQEINILAPYQNSMNCIEEYNSKCRNCFDWLNEVLEQVKKTLSLPEQYLLPKTPSQKRKRQRYALPTVSETNETHGSPILKNAKASLENLLVNDSSNCTVVRQSKRIVLQETSKTDNSNPRTRRQKYLGLDKNQERTSVKATSLQTISESPTYAIETNNTEPSQRIEGKKGNNGNNHVPKSPILTKTTYKTRSKKIHSETITKVEEKKGTKRIKLENSSTTPLKTAINKSLATTPSVKHRVQAYEENIKLVNTPRISQYSNTNVAASPEKKLMQDNIKSTKVVTPNALLAQQDDNNSQILVTKKLIRLSETRRRTSLVRYRLTAKKIKGKRSSTACQRKSRHSASSDNGSTVIQIKNNKTKMETSNSSRNQDQNLTPIVVLKKLQNYSAEEKILDNTSGDENYSDITTPSNSIPVTPSTVPATPLSAPANKSRKFEVSSLPKIGKTFTPCISAISTGKLHQNHLSRISKVPRTPQGLSYLNQSSIISRVLSLREQMTSKDREKYLNDEIKKKQRREEEVLRKKENLLKAKIEEQKKKREARMRKVSETRNRILQEKDHKRFLEIAKEERAAQKGAELKERKLQILHKKQMTRKQKLAEAEERRKKEECRLQKLKEQKEIQEIERQTLQLSKEKQKVMQVHTPGNQTSIQKKAMYNSYLSKTGERTLLSTEEKENEILKPVQVLNTTYEKKEENSESYEMTPARNKVSSSSDSTDNYDINDIKTDDETDNESTPKKKVPAWAQGMSLRASLLQQACNPPDVNMIFGNIDPPDLTKIFAIQRKRFQKRTSSAVWQNKSFLTP